MREVAIEIQGFYIWIFGIAVEGRREMGFWNAREGWEKFCRR